MSSTFSYLLYGLFAVGGAALCAVLPGRRRVSRSAVVLGLAVLGAMVVVVTTSLGGRSERMVPFGLFSLLAVVGSVRVITHTKPVYSAVYFVMTVIAVAGLLLLRNAEFLAVALVLIYAGAILVTYLFVIMLAQQSGTAIYDARAYEPRLAVLAGFVLAAVVAAHAGQPRRKVDFGADQSVRAAPAVVTRVPDAESVREPYLSGGHTFRIGATIMTRYIVVLQLAGILLLISMVGAIALSRKRVPAEETAGPMAPAGEIGKRVVPF